jgi:hypothetical protein
MVQRIVKLIGSAYSTSGDVHVQATYNGVEISNGPVTTTVAGMIPAAGQLPVPALNELLLFETTTDTTGQIPVTITVTGGTLFFTQFWMNYTGYVIEKGSANFANGEAGANTAVLVTTVEPDSYYSDPNINTAESDGISNLTKNGLPWEWRVNVGDLLGDWTYPVHDGETLTFDFFVDPAKVVLVAPDVSNPETIILNNGQTSTG